jgi:hypothetical protein
MDKQNERPKAPGLKWRKRRTGPPVPYWFADPKAIAAGYPLKSANLSRFADQPKFLQERAERLQSEMLLWMSGQRERALPSFDGTFGALLNLYESDPESNYNTGLKPEVRRIYGTYIRRLLGHIGELRIDHVDGGNLKRWFREWRFDPDGSDHLPRARMVLAVVKAAISYGKSRRKPGCKEFSEVIADQEFPTPRARAFAPTAAQIEAARKAAHADGGPRRALLYALVYDTTGRTFDFLGQWLPMGYQKPSAILGYGKKWVGPMWSAIDENLMLKIKPTKTENTTAVEVTFDLSVCPMVMEELAHIPPSERTGPLIIHERTGLPYAYQTFRDRWNADFRAAGMPKGMWCRDLRAGGVTEGGKAGASRDDRRKVAGHAQEKMTEKYDRDQLAAHRRVMLARAKYRAENES